MGNRTTESDYLPVILVGPETMDRSSIHALFSSFDPRNTSMIFALSRSPQADCKTSDNHQIGRRVRAHEVFLLVMLPSREVLPFMPCFLEFLRLNVGDWDDLSYMTGDIVILALNGISRWGLVETVAGWVCYRMVPQLNAEGHSAFQGAG